MLHIIMDRPQTSNHSTPLRTPKQGTPDQWQLNLEVMLACTGSKRPPRVREALVETQVLHCHQPTPGKKQHLSSEGHCGKQILRVSGAASTVLVHCKRSWIVVG
jgi:hypothetical protein